MGERRREAEGQPETTREEETRQAKEAVSREEEGVEAAPEERAEEIETKRAGEEATEGREEKMEGAGEPGTEEGVEAATEAAEYEPESAGESEPEEGVEASTEAAEYEPESAGESEPEEGVEASTEAAEYEPEESEEPNPADDEEIEAAAGRDEGDEPEPERTVSRAPRAVRRSRPQGHNGSAEPEVEKGIERVGMRGRLAGSGRKLVGKVAHFFAEHGVPHGLNRAGLALAAKSHPTLLGQPIHLLEKFKAAATALDKEATLGPVLSAEVNAALRRMTEHDPALKGMLDKAYGYAVFPLVGKATAVLGIGVGRGQVFERGRLIGYAGIVQLTLGVQVGGQTYDELIVFENEGALERFKSGKLAFAMNASAVLVKAGAAATTNYASGTAVFVHPEGGLGIELGLGGQKLIFRKKFLGAPGLKPPGDGRRKRSQRPLHARRNRGGPVVARSQRAARTHEGNRGGRPRREAGRRHPHSEAAGPHREAAVQKER